MTFRQYDNKYEIVINVQQKVAIEACEKGDLNLVKLFHRNVHMNIMDQYGNLFSSVCHHGHLEVIKWLYEHYNGKIHHLGFIFGYMNAAQRDKINIMDYLIKLPEFNDDVLKQLQEKSLLGGNEKVLMYLRSHNLEKKRLFVNSIRLNMKKNNFCALL